PLLASLVELDRELVAVDRGDVAVAEFLVKDAVADRELGNGAGRLGNELAFDGERQAAARLAARARATAPPLPRCGAIHRFLPIWVNVGIVLQAAAANPAARLRALPARRAVARAEMRHLVEARGAGIAVGSKATL